MTGSSPPLPPEVIARRLAQHLTVHRAAPGAVLCDAGAPDDRVLLVIHGIVESYGTGQVHARELIAAAPGDAVFPHTVRARTEVTFASVPVTALDAAELSDRTPEHLTQYRDPRWTYRR